MNVFVPEKMSKFSNYKGINRRIYIAADKMKKKYEDSENILYLYFYNIFLRNWMTVEEALRQNRKIHRKNNALE
jgi:hypothetical protein